ncbi:hypothetical protein LIER_05501 [Lithospermum erythrorhizon]|uniref:Uncharacterized protein n=1 Tax=Lithospermum erythrorhizon TaxID=34254 RepID=A0AAV3P3F9_LITER
MDCPSISAELNEQAFDIFTHETYDCPTLFHSSTLDRLESNKKGKFWNLKSKSDVREKRSTPVTNIEPEMQKEPSSTDGFEYGYDNNEVEGILDRLNLRKGVRRLRMHPIFQLSKPAKKSKESEQCTY